MKKVALLGATGSIGTQALEIIDAHPELELCAVAVGEREAEARQIAEERGVEHVSVAGSPPLEELIERSDPDVVLNGVVGFAGLPATLAALERGIDLALANKESLVAAGDLALAAKERGRGRILPVDSEHSAAFQCLDGRAEETLHSLVLTASGGPFRGRTRAELASVSPSEALAHPTWSMGPKITVDSATLMNKGLEVIEAHYLFGLDYDRLDVVVHPESIIHGLAEFSDGSTIAQMAMADMRLPIQLALGFPDRLRAGIKGVDLAALGKLTFEELDRDAFPALDLAYRAGRLGQTYPAALNAANEVAVLAFLEGKIRLIQIADVVSAVLDEHEGAPVVSEVALARADRWARTRAAEIIESL